LALPDARGDAEAPVSGPCERKVWGASSEFALGYVDTGEVARPVLGKRSRAIDSPSLESAGAHGRASQVRDDSLDERLVVEVERPLVAVAAC
jgi:hypothetical protein